MQIVTLSEKAKELEASKRVLGITSARIEAARSKGTARTAAKRVLLRTLEDPPAGPRPALLPPTSKRPALRSFAIRATPRLILLLTPLAPRVEMID